MIQSHAQSRLRVPNASRLAAVVFALLVFYGSVRSVILNGHPPLLLPALAALLSIACLYAIRLGADPLHSAVRLGFHVGMFTYFLAMPLMYPETIEQGIPESVHNIVGWMLIITLVGFEVGYQLKKLVWRRRSTVRDYAPLKGRKGRVLLVLMCVGLFAWFMTAVDYSIAARVSVWDILLSMRADSGVQNSLSQLGQWSYLFAGGIYLATAVAFLFVTSHERQAWGVTLPSWCILAVCAALGFLSNSRALFLYSFAPLALALWVNVTRIRLGKAARVPLIFAVSLIVGGAWIVMSAIRSQNTPDYETAWENVKPVEAARGAFDIYSSCALIVEYFPNQIDYEYGRSLIPLGLGWVPRSVWRDKPYPFSIYANTIRGETLEDRSASIAVGLPGEGYGNFGLLGALIWGVLMGLACRVADDYLRKFCRDDSLRLYLSATMCIWAAMIVRGGVPEMFYMGLQVNLFPLTLAALLNAIARTRRSSTRKFAPAAQLAQSASSPY